MSSTIATEVAKIEAELKSLLPCAINDNVQRPKELLLALSGIVDMDVLQTTGIRSIVELIWELTTDKYVAIIARGILNQWERLIEEGTFTPPDSTTSSAFNISFSTALPSPGASGAKSSSATAPLVKAKPACQPAKCARKRKPRKAASQSKSSTKPVISRKDVSSAVSSASPIFKKSQPTQESCASLEGGDGRKSLSSKANSPASTRVVAFAESGPTQAVSSKMTCQSTMYRPKPKFADVSAQTSSSSSSSSDTTSLSSSSKKPCPSAANRSKSKPLNRASSGVVPSPKPGIRKAVSSKKACRSRKPKVADVPAPRASLSSLSSLGTTSSSESRSSSKTMSPTSRSKSKPLGRASSRVVRSPVSGPRQAVSSKVARRSRKLKLANDPAQRASLSSLSSLDTPSSSESKSSSKKSCLSPTNRYKPKRLNLVSSRKVPSLKSGPRKAVSSKVAYRLRKPKPADAPAPRASLSSLSSLGTSARAKPTDLKSSALTSRLSPGPTVLAKPTNVNDKKNKAHKGQRISVRRKYAKALASRFK